jgi:enamine deaminase RidA (YjgF/YER057c/UK114 family)
MIVTKKIINPPSLAKPVGFNHGLLVTGGSLLFLAGQDASNAEGQIVGPGDVYAQLAQVLQNLKAVVEAAGGQMQDIVKLNVFVKNRDDYVKNLRTFGPLFKEHFGKYYPAMALFEVTAFFKDEALIELEGMAVIADE